MKWLSSALRYAWHTVVQVFYLLVVVYVFSRLHDRFETIVVAILGVLYVTVRTIGMSLGLTTLQTSTVLARGIDELRAVDDDEYRRRMRDDQGEADDQLFRAQAYAGITGVFLAMISLVCLWRLFSVL